MEDGAIPHCGRVMWRRKLNPRALTRGFSAQLVVSWSDTNTYMDSGIHAGDDAPQTVSAAERTTQPRLPELRRSSQRQSVQTPESGPVDGENCFYHQGEGGDPLPGR
jgi:hypothetical protein